MSLFQQWKAYLLKNNLALKCLLLLDNEPRHPQCKDDLFPEIKVVFVPPDSTSLLQPMGQTVTATLRPSSVTMRVAQ
jgi:hypothetical protein